MTFTLALFMTGCKGQTKTTTMENQVNNPLLCDVETGMCATPAAGDGAARGSAATVGEKPVKVIYYTDPICSSCWGIEPQLRQLKLEYGNDLEIEYRMGGLLPDWSYNSGGISKPSDVAHHWDEVSHYYDMPIDGDLWLEDPLNSSYPPSIAFKAAQLQNEDKAAAFLREIREMLFLQKKNIAKWEHLEAAARNVGLDVAQLKSDYEGKGRTLFTQDLELGQRLGVRGFPTMFFVDGLGNQERVYGSRPYATYVNALTKLHPTAQKAVYDTSWVALFSKFPTLTSREYSELSGKSRKDSEEFLEQLYRRGDLDKVTTKNGMLWKKIGPAH